jgi:dienelactone hydrolase
MKYIFFFYLLIVDVPLFAQKQPIDTSSFKKWLTRVGFTAISHDGKYASYSINKSEGGSILTLLEIKGTWKKEFKNVSSGSFLKKSGRFIFKKADSLCLVKLKTGAFSYITNVNSYKLSMGDNNEWVAYQQKKLTKQLILRNLETEKEQSFDSVTAYWFNEKGSVLLLKTETKKDSSFCQSLQWINLIDVSKITIWTGEKVDNFTFDVMGRQLAFIAQDKKDKQESNSLWYYKAGLDKAYLSANLQTPGIENGLIIKNDVPIFSKDCNHIYFKLQQTVVKPGIKSDAVQVDVWSYTDVKLQSEQLRELSFEKSYVAVINIDAIENENKLSVSQPLSRRVMQLEKDGETIIGSMENINGNFILINHQNGNPNESWWNAASRTSVYLISIKDGSRKILKEKLKYSKYIHYVISPNNKYVIYYDPDQINYFSYDISSGKTLNITQKIPVRINNEDYDDIPYPSPSVGLGGWLEQDLGLLIYDNYDIWVVDPSGIKSPVNFTNGYGRNHNIKFRLVYEDETLGKAPLKKDAILMISAFNKINKYNGFFKKTIGANGDPELLTMGPYNYYHVSSQSPPNTNFLAGTSPPIKAKDSNTWIVQRMSASEAPNYYLTWDFKNYTPLTNVLPHKDNNWLTAELVHWQMFDGRQGEGILYKPENFNSKKKYPVIFNYYEKLSDRLYDYPTPNTTNSNINIPYFVSNGYLVFTPNIYYETGELGQSVYNSVVSAAKYLFKLPWVDSTKIALQGHSFGGYETNYLITHTHLFAAAAEACGATDLISSYGGLGHQSFSRQFIFETSQGRIGVTPWQAPNLYIKNSPIFNADFVTTPLLMMHNKKDGAVPWEQAVELFTAMRRLQKKVWMLQYDNGVHGVSRKDAEDYTIRLTQFFDHYLKGAPAPKWMTKGIDASQKGIETGFELDPQGNCGVNCSICD